MKLDVTYILSTDSQAFFFSYPPDHTTNVPNQQLMECPQSQPFIRQNTNSDIFCKKQRTSFST